MSQAKTRQMLSDPEWMYLSDILGLPKVPVRAGTLIAWAIELMIRDGDLNETNKFAALEYWAVREIQEREH